MKTFAEQMGIIAIGKCSLCGEEGTAVDSETVAAFWRKNAHIKHLDINICLENLEKKKK